jgi:hypothetical protein
MRAVMGESLNITRLEVLKSQGIPQSQMESETKPIVPDSNVEFQI